jgi:hypothetical protein
MEVRFRLEAVLSAIRQARAQLVLHPDVFDATELLKVCEAELGAILSEMFPSEEPHS